jgi:hypothetical protein
MHDLVFDRPRFSFLRAAVGITWALSVSAAVASPTVSPASQIVNVDATLYGDPTPPNDLLTLNFSEPAGTYLITPVNPQIDPRALFTAWNPFSPPTATWDSGLDVRVASTGQTFRIGEDGDFSTPTQAFADPLNQPLIVTLLTPDVLQFYVPDFFLSDNQGGASETITPVPSPTPEPSSLTVLLLAFMTMLTYKIARFRP